MKKYEEKRAEHWNWLRYEIFKESKLYKTLGYRIAFLHGVRFVFRLMSNRALEQRIKEITDNYEAL